LPSAEPLRICLKIPWHLAALPLLLVEVLKYTIPRLPKLFLVPSLVFVHTVLHILLFPAYLSELRVSPLDFPASSPAFRQPRMLNYSFARGQFSRQ